MFFISRDKGQSFFLPQHEYEVIQTDAGTSVTIRNPLKQIIFRPFSGPGFATNALPLKHGRERAEGYFDSTVEKYRPHVEQEEAEDYLFNHKKYGVDFIAIGEDGKAMASLEWKSPAHRSQPFLSASGSGVHCALCDKQVDKKGLHKHLDSAAHIERLEEVERNEIKKLVRSAS